jgi:Na+-transporting NADH:ubiquinone oxidoreductase subunit B
MGEEVGFWPKIGQGAILVLPILIVAYAVGLGIEFAFCIAKQEQVNEGFLVSGMLIPLIMPVDVPLWMVAVGTAFAVIIGKECFGGTGMNVLNVALTCRAFLFFAYPTDMSGNKVWVNTGGPETAAVDGHTGETFLAQAANAESGPVEFYVREGTKGGPEAIEASFSDMVMGTIPGSIGETSVIAIAIGAFILLWTGIGSWRIMLSCLLGGIAMSGIFNWVHSAADVSPFLGHGRFHVRSRLHGHRPGNCCPDQ